MLINHSSTRRKASGVAQRQQCGYRCVIFSRRSKLPLCSSAAKTIKVTNQGNAALNFSKITLAGPDSTQFTQTNTCTAAIAPGAECNISVVYKPTVEGPKLAVLSLEGNFANAATVIGIVADGKSPMQGGLWRGNDPFSGKPMVGIIAENRQAVFMLQDGTQYFGAAGVKAERLSAMLAVGNAVNTTGCPNETERQPSNR